MVDIRCCVYTFAYTRATFDSGKDDTYNNIVDNRSKKHDIHYAALLLDVCINKTV